MCVCVCCSGGCRVTVTGTNFNVSSTAQFHLRNDEHDIGESSSPVCLTVSWRCIYVSIINWTVTVINYYYGWLAIVLLYLRRTQAPSSKKWNVLRALAPLGNVFCALAVTVKTCVLRVMTKNRYSIFFRKKIASQRKPCILRATTKNGQLFCGCPWLLLMA